MEFNDVLASRHSVREFVPDEVPRDVLERVIRAAAQSPSSENEQPWTFYVTTGQARAALGAIVAQTTVHLNDYIDVLGPERYQTAVQWFTSFGDAPVLIAVATPDSENEFQLTNRLLSVGAALENLLLAATAEGLGACPFTFSYWVKSEMAELLGIESGHSVISIVAVGWPAGTKAPAPEKRDDVAVWLG
jgi:nitroreductase